jgi:hypothetical protein
MKVFFQKLLLLTTLLCFFSSGYSQEENSTLTNEAQVTENSSLYNTDWKLDKMTPKFSSDIELTVSFDKATQQLKVIKILKSEPVLKGTNLVTTKNESIEVYQWSYAIKDAEYEGDDVKSVSYDYETIELKAEGYTFKINTIDDTSLVLEVLKAPEVIFGNSLFDVKKMYFIK